MVGDLSRMRGVRQVEAVMPVAPGFAADLCQSKAGRVISSVV
jgi:hypothetical protein